MKNWLVFMDNKNENNKFPKDWVLSEAFRFISIFPKNYNVEMCIYWKNKIYFSKLPQKDNIIEIQSNVTSFDGVVMSLTRNAVMNLLNDPNPIKELFSKINQETKIFLCTGVKAFEQIKTLENFRNRNIIFVKKIAIKWFNYHLSDKVKDYIL